MVAASRKEELRNTDWLTDLLAGVGAALAREAAEQGTTPERLALDELRRLFPEADAPALDLDAALAALRGRLVPQSLSEMAPRIPTPPGETAIGLMQERWPGEESEEELLALLAADRAKDRGRA